MSTLRLTFLYPFMFAPLRPRLAQSASRTARRGVKSTARRTQQNAVPQRYGTANEPPPHLGGGRPIAPTTAKEPARKEPVTKEAKAVPKTASRAKSESKKTQEKKPLEEQQVRQEAAAPEVPPKQEQKVEPKQSVQADVQETAPAATTLPPTQEGQTAGFSAQLASSVKLDAAESAPSKPASPSLKVPSQSPLNAVLNMPSSETSGKATAPVYDVASNKSANLSNSDEHKPPHISTPPYVHHFDTYGLVKRLEAGGWTPEQTVTIMKAVRLILAGNMELAREGLVSKSNVENETYLFRAACSELRTEIQTKRKAEIEKSRTERSQLQHEVDILGQRLTQEGGNLKDELKGMFDDRKMAIRNEQRSMDTKIQELNYRITVSLNSDSRSDVEGVRWIITKRAITALAICVTMVLSSLKIASSNLQWHEEERKRLAALGLANGGNNSPHDGGQGHERRSDAGMGAGEIFVNQGDNPAYVSLG